MSLLSYHELCWLAENGIIEGVKPEAINGTSIDVHLGSTILKEDMQFVRSVSLRDKQALAMNEVNIAGKSYMLLPGEFILAHTVEKFNLPDNISAEFKLNSSGARIGLENALATWCLVKGTRVATLDGGSVAIEDIKEGTWLYSADKEGRIVPARSSESFVTKLVEKTVRVTLDNGEYFECTPDHKVLKRNNTYCEAANLLTGDALMPFKRRTDNEGRESIYSNHKVVSVEEIIHKEPVPVYDLTVPGYGNFSLSCGAVVHNCDPHWHGSVLTLELKNFTRSHIIELHDGCRIGQMIFHKSEPVPRERGYAVRGRYNQDTSVSGVKEK